MVADNSAAVLSPDCLAARFCCVENLEKWISGAMKISGQRAEGSRIWVRESVPDHVV